MGGYGRGEGVPRPQKGGRCPGDNKVINTSPPVMLISYDKKKIHLN